MFVEFGVLAKECSTLKTPIILFLFKNHTYLDCHLLHLFLNPTCATLFISSGQILINKNTTIHAKDILRSSIRIKLVDSQLNTIQLSLQVCCYLPQWLQHIPLILVARAEPMLHVKQKVSHTSQVTEEFIDLML